MASFFDKLYLSSPIWAQQIGVSIYGWQWYRRRFGPSFHKLVAEFKARDSWSQEQFEGYQQEQLTYIFRWALQAPYYRELFAKADVQVQNVNLDTLRHVPLLSKDTLRQRSHDLVTRKDLPSGTRVFKSSGTTGTPTAIYYTREFHALELAVPEARNLSWANVTYRDRRVMFGVRKVCHFKQDRPPFWRFSQAENMAYASIYHLSPRNLPAYMDFLRLYQPKVIMGYPSALYTIARFALTHGDLPAPAKAIFTTSETVSEQYRQTIELAWQCKIYDRYGAVENCLFASQCEYGRYHVSPEVGIIEIIDKQGNLCPPGIIGEVICTGLQNNLQPLIRYQIGDIASWSQDQACLCGRQMPILEGVEGRFEDICYTSDGREMLRFDTVFKGIHNIQEAQVIQQDIDLFTILVVPSEGFGNHDIEIIKGNMSQHVGTVETHVKLVDKIDRTASGKFRAVICKLSATQKDALRNPGNRY